MIRAKNSEELVLSPLMTWVWKTKAQAFSSPNKFGLVAGLIVPIKDTRDGEQNKETYSMWSHRKRNRKGGPGTATSVHFPDSGRNFRVRGRIEVGREVWIKKQAKPRCPPQGHFPKSAGVRWSRSLCGLGKNKGQSSEVTTAPGCGPPSLITDLENTRFLESKVTQEDRFRTKAHLCGKVQESVRHI